MASTPATPTVETPQNRCSTEHPNARPPIGPEPRKCRNWPRLTRHTSPAN